MDKIIDFGSLSLFGIVLIIAITITLLFVLGLMTGNVTTMRLFNRLGIHVFSGKIAKDYRLVKSINKDTVGWIHIPDTSYSPIMKSNGGVYKSKDYLKRPSTKGELYVSDGRNSFDLSNIANKSDNTFTDLTIIMGSSAVRNMSIRECKFTLLKKYLNTDLKQRHPDIIVIDNGKQRIFNLLFAVELGLENRKKFKFTDRTSFLESMKEMAFVKTDKSYDKDVLILNGSTGLDTILVFLVEKG